MRFTRLHLILLVIGFLLIGSGGILITVNMQQEFIATDKHLHEISKISGNYSYSPIEKTTSIKDFSGGNASAFTTEGEIRVNINSSQIEELDRLPGVGPATARRIISHRLMNGPYITVSELEKVKGIGPKTISKFGNIAFIGEPGEMDPTQIDSLMTSNSRQSDSQTVTMENVPCGSGRININTASSEDLQTLPRIGPKTAERIIADRETNGPFAEISEFTRVRGIGPKTLARIKDLICAE